MSKDYLIKQGKGSRLPSIHKQNNQILQFSSKLSYKKNGNASSLFDDKKKHALKQYPKNISQIKAQNFLNQTFNLSTLSSASVMLNISDCIKIQQGKKFENKSQFSEQNLMKSNFVKLFAPVKQNATVESIYLKVRSNHGSVQKINNKNSFQRAQLLNLAKWIDERLQNFNKKSCITVNEIIDYKQHILNYGLGKIMESVSKKCQQEGDLLKILWQNSFKIFQQILQIVSSSMDQKQKNHLHQEMQSKQIYDANLLFLKRQNQKISLEMTNVYDKMKKVIIWNKKLRKQKRHINILNKITQYRNQTYSQALQQTIQMFLKAVPQSSTLNFAKKIISKLARQKRRKRKGFERKQIQEDFKIQAKKYVTSWLQRNGFNQVQDQEIDPSIYLNNDEKIELTKIEDENLLREVNIFEYFKLLDIGVQATQQMRNISCQYDNQLKPKLIAKGTLTDNIFKKNFQIQTNMNENVWFKQETLKKNNSNTDKSTKVLRRNEKKKSNVSRFSQKSDKFKQKGQNKKIIKENIQTLNQQKNIKFTKNANRNINISKFLLKEDKQSSSIRYLKQDTIQSLDQEKNNKFYEKDFTIISEKKSQEFIFDSDEEAKNNPSQRFRISISKLNEDQSKFYKMYSNKLQKEQNPQGRQVSIKDFTELGMQQQLIVGAGRQNNLKKLWRQIQNKKINDSQKRDSRLSVNFIKYDSDICSMKRLQKKYFNQFYQEGKINSLSKEKQRENLFQTVVRRRSFYKKGKVMFQNAYDVEESKQIKVNLYKSVLHYKTHRNRTLAEISEEEQQRVNQINKKMAIASNLAKSKTLAASKEIFKQISEVCKKNKKQPPKNKQFFNSSLISISKNVGALVMDYIRQIKRQKDEIQIDCQKIYYPLHTILMDKMNWKYGLKDISQKKIKDFLQKILMFAPVSQKISLYSLLFGMEIEGIGADELLVYLKCLVYLQKKQAINSSIHILKQTNLFEKVLTDQEIVEQNINRILKDFFDKQGQEIVKNKIDQYLKQNPKFVSIQRISQIIIRSLMKRKQEFKKDAQLIYKLCIKGSNIFTNLYKILKIANNYCQQRTGSIFYQQKQMADKNLEKLVKKSQKKWQMNISETLKQFIKRSDVIDEIYGKSISFDRFLTAYVVTNFPKYDQLLQIFKFISSAFGQKYKQLNQIKSNNSSKYQILKYSQENVKFLEDLQKKWQIKNNEKIEEQNWQFSIAKTVAQHIQGQTKGILGKLNIISNQIQNFFFAIENKNQVEAVNTKESLL